MPYKKKPSISVFPADLNIFVPITCMHPQAEAQALHVYSNNHLQLLFTPADGLQMHSAKLQLVVFVILCIICDLSIVIHLLHVLMNMKLSYNETQGLSLLTAVHNGIVGHYSNE